MRVTSARARSCSARRCRARESSGQKYLPRLLEHAPRGELDPSYLAPHRSSLEEAPRGYEMFKKKEDGCVRAVFAGRLVRLLDLSIALCHTERMTARGRLNARLEPELERKLAYLRQRTGLATSDVVRTSIERFYEAMRAGGEHARTILKETGFLASGSGPADLSESYKQELSSSLSKKHR